MRKAFLFLVFMTSIFGLQNLVVESNIDSVDEKKKTIEFIASGLKLGEVGYIYKSTTDYQFIIYQAEVLSIKDQKVTAKIIPYDTLKQPYLPSPSNYPSSGDKVIFHRLDKKAFLIAPTMELYNSIKENHKEVDFLSSDLLLGYLYAYGGNDPTPNFLKEACNVYMVGLLYIVSKNELSILDCQSLKKIQSYELDTSAAINPITPFYSRIEPVTTGTLFSVFAKKRSRYYFSYFTNMVNPEISYKSLLSEEKPIVDAKRKKQKEEMKKAKAEAKKKK